MPREKKQMKIVHLSDEEAYCTLIAVVSDWLYPMLIAKKSIAEIVELLNDCIHKYSELGYLWIRKTPVENEACECCQCSDCFDCKKCCCSKNVIRVDESVQTSHGNPSTINKVHDPSKYNYTRGMHFATHCIRNYLLLNVSNEEDISKIMQSINDADLMLHLS